MKIEVIAGQEGSQEYSKALELRDQFIIRFGDSSADSRFAWIFPNHDCSSQRGIRDVDILIYADIRSNVSFRVGDTKKTCYIQNFVANIELCNRDEWWRDGSHVWVSYRGEEHDKTQQNLSQVYALKDQIKRASEYSKKKIKPPRFESVLWMTAVDKPFPDDIALHTLCARQGLEDLLMIIASRGNREIDQYGEEIISYQAWRTGGPQKDIKNYLRDVYKIHENKQTTFGSVTRRQIDAVSGETLDKYKEYKAQGLDGFLVLSGDPGTGKTITLLNLAYEILMEQRNILFLTYNIALACDLRQMWWHLKGIKPVLGGLNVKSSYSFFGSLWKHLGMDSSGHEFLSEYETSILSIMHETILGYTDQEIKQLRRANLDVFGPSKILIDEGQDWDKREIEIIEKIFGHQRILVAQSMSQLVRSNSPVNWHDWLSDGREKNSHLDLKISMRQKENLLNFNRTVASLLNQRIRLSKSRLAGGTVEVISGNYTQEIHQRIISRHKSLGATPYEYMFLIPNGYDFSSRVASGEIGIGSSAYLDLSKHELRKTFEKDGDLYNQERLRVLNYQSSRGLEAWTCVCLSIDRFYKDIADSFESATQVTDLLSQQSELVTDSAEAQLSKFLFNWLMIPLTRAIDTLVLHVDDKESDVGRALIAACAQMD